MAKKIQSKFLACWWFKSAIILMYFIIWIIFGCLFHNEANKSDGESFIFQEDVALGAQASIFQELKGNDLPRELAKKLIIEGKRFRYIQNIFEVDRQQYWYSTEPIGMYWAWYYRHMFEKEGVTYCSIKHVADNTYPLAKMQGRADYIDITINSDDIRKLSNPTYEYILRLYKTKNGMSLDPNSVDYPELCREQRIWLIQPKESPIFRGYGPNKFMPIIQVDLILRDSLNFMDSSPIELKRVVEGNRTYPLSDFLYFSAVTITTLGYGDILPNNTYIRRLVMAETFLGVILVGTFVSSLFVSRIR